MAQILFYIEAIYILLSLLYSTSDSCQTVSVEASNTVVNASQNFSIYSESTCGFLHFKVIYSGDPATGSPSSSVTNLNGIVKSTYFEKLKANFSMISDHSELKLCNEVTSIDSTLYVIAPSPGKYYIHCYTQAEGCSWKKIYSETVTVEVLRDEVLLPPAQSSTSSESPSTSTTTSTVPSSTASPSSSHIVPTTTTSTVVQVRHPSTSAVPSSPSLQGSRTNFETTISTGSTPCLQDSSLFRTLTTTTVTKTSTQTVTYTTTPTSKTTTEETRADDNESYHIEKKMVIITVSAVGFLLLLATIATVTATVMACRFKSKIRQHSRLRLNSNLASSPSNSNEDMAYVNKMAIQDPPLSPL